MWLRESAVSVYKVVRYVMNMYRNYLFCTTNAANLEPGIAMVTFFQSPNITCRHCWWDMYTWHPYTHDNPAWTHFTEGFYISFSLINYSHTEGCCRHLFQEPEVPIPHAPGTRSKQLFHTQHKENVTCKCHWWDIYMWHAYPSTHASPQPQECCFIP